MVDYKIKDKLFDYCKQIKNIETLVRKDVIDKEVKIISNYNGQPYGSSKPSLKGKVFKIKDIIIDDKQIYFHNGNIDHCYISIHEVEFLYD